MMKRVFALFLCVLMCLSILPVSAFAEGGGDSGAAYTVYCWYTSPRTVDEQGAQTFVKLAEPIQVDAGTNYVIGRLPGSILQQMLAYATDQGLRDHCIQRWTIKGTDIPFDIAGQKVSDAAAEDHTLNLVASWGMENGHQFGDWTTTKEANCYEEGSRVHTCVNCGYSETVAISGGHSMTSFEEHPASCTENGNIAYYVCENCGRVFADPEGYTELTYDSVVIPAAGHTMEYYEAQPATCVDAGWNAFYYCTVCQQYFSDAEGYNPIDQAANTIPVDPDAHAWGEDGVCTRAGCNATQNRESAADTETVTDNVTASTNVSNTTETVLQQGTTETTVQQGTTEVTAQQGTTETTQNTGAAPSVEENTEENTNQAEVFFAASEESQQNAVEQTQPSDCSGGHALKHYESWPATCKDAGWIAFYYCERCQKYFSDEEGLNEIQYEDTLVPVDPDAHAWGEDGVCLICGKTREEDSQTEIIEIDAEAVSEPANNDADPSWVLSGTGTLTISGTGDMADFNTSDNRPPWSDNIPNIKEVIINDGVTSIGDYAFSGCTELTIVTIPRSITSIGTNVFDGCTKLTAVIFRDTRAKWNDMQASGSIVSENVKVTCSDDYCGSDLTWEYADGVLTITGHGDMTDYSTEALQPWAENFNNIKTLKLVKDDSSGITHIGNYAFNGCTNMEFADLTDLSSNASIGTNAFPAQTSLSYVTQNSNVIRFANENKQFSGQVLDQNSDDGYIVLGRKGTAVTLSPDQRSALDTAARSAGNVTIPSNINWTFVFYTIKEFNINANGISAATDDNKPQSSIDITLNLRSTESLTGRKIVAYYQKPDTTVLELASSLSSNGNDLTVTLPSETIIDHITVVVFEAYDPTVPTLVVDSEIYDDGETDAKKGAIQISNRNSRALEWVWSDSDTDPDADVETTQLNEDTLSGLSSGGYYHFRFAATGEGTTPSGWTHVVIKKYYTITLSKGGTSNGTAVVTIEGDEAEKYNNQDNVYYAEAGTDVAIDFQPAQKYFLSTVAINGTTVSNPTDPYIISSINAKTVVNYKYKAPAVKKTELVDDDTYGDLLSAAEDKLNELCLQKGKTTATAAFAVYDVEPVWTDNTPMTAEEVEEHPLTFSLNAPDNKTSATHTFEIWHYNEEEQGFTEKVSSSLTASRITAFSPFAAFAIPKAAASAEKQPQPELQVSDVYDANGASGKGSIKVTNAGTKRIEYYYGGTSSTTPSSTTTGTILNGDTLSNITKTGYYFFRFKADSTYSQDSDWERTQVLQFYTITMDMKTGCKGYSFDPDLPNYKEQKDVYYALKGETIKVTITPAKYYELSTFKVNSKSVEWKNNSYTISKIDEKTTIECTFKVTKPVVDKTAPVIDDGTTQKGKVTFKSGDDRIIEYYLDTDKVLDEGITWSEIGNSTKEFTSGGVLFYRYAKTGSVPASEIDYTVIGEYYTVTFQKKGSGKGTYTVDEEKFPKYKENVYLVEKSEKITVTFKPDNNYWLYEINYVSDSTDNKEEYVGAENVKTNFTSKEITEKTKITYGFSDQSKSPKTGDSADVDLWIAEEILSFLGMATITWYLFRRKKVY